MQTKRTSSVPNGLDALGHTIPPERLSNALWHIRDMVPGVKTSEAMALIGRVAQEIERDEPYAAQRWAMGGAPLPRSESSPQGPVEVDMAGLPRLDYTGGLRLFCALLTDPPEGGNG